MTLLVPPDRMYERDFEQQREQMVREQLAGRDIQDQRVLQAMLRVPRHAFVPQELRSLAYDDGPLPIGENQTISQPYVVALMSQLLALRGRERVLEIGTGSGYQAAVLAEIAAEVYTIERFQSLADRAAACLAELGYSNVHVIYADGSRGLKEHAPFQGILVTAAAPLVPQAILNQLDQNGTLVIPVGGRKGQVLQVWTRQGSSFLQRRVAPVAFVPLRGELGWHNTDWKR